jgi:hypothetical protein
MTDHNPLPWHDDGFSIKDNAGQSVGIYGFMGCGNNNANRRFIIAVVNSHTALLAAAKESIALADENCILLPDGTPNRTAECQQCYDRTASAIAATAGDAP